MAVPAAPGRLSGLHEEAGQFVFLTGHFFGRLFRNDVVDFEDQMKGRLIAVLSVLAIIVGWSSEMLLFKYQFLPDAGRSWQEKSYLFTLMMIIFGIVTLLEWDVLFPDRRDFLNLMPLPIRLRTIFSAKLASFVLFVGLFSVAMNSLSSILFSGYLAEWRVEKSLLFAGRYIVSHLLSGFAACFFVFFACIFLQFLLMVLLPFRLYRRVSLLFRFVLIAIFVFLLLAFLLEPAILDSSFLSMDKLKETGDPLLFRFPPFWFVGLYERLLGTHDPVFEAQARTAGLSILASLIGFAMASGLSYYRQVRKTLESGQGGRKGKRLREGWEGWFGKTILRTPEERAIDGFVSGTIRSSPKQRVTMAYYLAIAAAVIMLFVVANREGFRLLTPSNINLLALPLFLSLVILAGIRALVNVPASPGANWIFQVTETPDGMRYAAGLKKSIFFRWILPLFGLVFALHLFIWDFGPALEHAVFGLIVSCLGLEAFFFRFRKVPFACGYLPEKMKLPTRGVPFAVAFILFLSAAARIERELLRAPSYFAIFLAISACFWMAFWIGNRRFYRGTTLIYEEEPEPALVTFPENT